ncbi:MAG TPA: CHAP domain-containing protein, partial [Ktedonobacteraceae bacterium]|nr:CHAP domain-containing protein [Ktedonobacteraceae bacterium]
MGLRSFRIFFASMFFISMLVVSNTFPANVSALSLSSEFLHKANNTSTAVVPSTSQKQNMLPLPSWWNGDTCDATYYQAHNQAGAKSFILGDDTAKWRGIEACGPEPGLNSNSPYIASVMYPNATVPELEWECVELSMRYMYLAYGILPYALPNGAKDIVKLYPDMSGAPLIAYSNPTSDVVPQIGDILAYGPTKNNSAGHTSVVINVNYTSPGNGKLTVLEQNMSASGINLDIPVVGGTVGSDITGWLHDPASLNLLSLQSGTPGTRVTVSGKGMQANEQVGINFVDSKQNSTQLGTTIADSAGTFSTVITIPASTQPGSYSIYASGMTSNYGTDRAAFTVNLPPEYPIPTSGSQPLYLTSGPDGNFWFTESYGNKIGKITPNGKITEYPLPSCGDTYCPYGITAGPDGDLWVAI